MSRSPSLYPRLAEIRPQPRREGVCVVRFALPDHEHVPTLGPQCILVSSVTFDVGAKFVLPVRGPRLRARRSSTPRVPVPEAPVNEDHLAPAREDQVGRPGQVAAVESEAIAESMREPPHAHLGDRVPPLDARHQGAA